MPNTVEVLGAKELRRTLRKAGDDLQAMKDLHSTISRYVAMRAAAMAPRRSGNLAASVRGSKQVSAAVIRAGGAKVPYAGPIHWGWPARNIAANEFLTEAAAVTQPTWLKWYEIKVEQILGHVKGK